MKIDTETGEEQLAPAPSELKVTQVSFHMTCNDAPGMGTREAPSLLELAFVVDQVFVDGSKKRSLARFVVCSNSFTIPINPDRRTPLVQDLLLEINDFFVRNPNAQVPFVKIEGNELHSFPFSLKNGLVPEMFDVYTGEYTPVIYTTSNNLPDAIFRHLWQDLGVLSLQDGNRLTLNGRVVLVGWRPELVFNQLRGEIGRPVSNGKFTTIPILDYFDDPKTPVPMPSMVIDVRTLVNNDTIAESMSPTVDSNYADNIFDPHFPENGISKAVAIANLAFRD